MGKTVRAIVTPSLLTWARELDSITVDEVAQKMNIKVEKILSWEEGVAMPTLNQARQLAKIYRVPFVFFYLPDPPKKPKRIEKVDYRTIGNMGELAVFSRELRWFLRDIEERRDTLLELYRENNEEPVVFPLKIKKLDVENIASRIRVFLNLTWDKQRSFRQPINALNYCIAKLEEYDVLIFQASKINSEEMRGLSVAYQTMPIIALNRKDEYSARLFTLIHELSHIITNTSGICNETIEGSNPQYDIEMFCNRVAGQTLVPDDLLKNHNVYKKIQAEGATDASIKTLSKDFAVSREVILIRLMENKAISKAVCFNIMERYKEEYQLYKNRKDGGFLPPAIDKGSQLGKLYSKSILSAYYNERITGQEAATCLLNLKTHHFSKLERWCFG